VTLVAAALPEGNLRLTCAAWDDAGGIAARLRCCGRARAAMAGAEMEG